MCKLEPFEHRGKEKGGWGEFSRKKEREKRFLVKGTALGGVGRGEG